MGLVKTVKRGEVGADSRNRGEDARVARPRSGRVLCALLAGGLLLSTGALCAATAVADDAGTADDAAWQQAYAEVQAGTVQPSAYAASDNADTGAGDMGATSALGTTDAATAFEGLPTRYDLRDPNGDGDRSDSVVAPVKQQHPWGTCWSFSICAASETSILSEAGATYAERSIDLSELQLVRSAYRDGGAPESVVGAAQAGEGFHSDGNDPNAALDLGGQTVYGSTILSAGIGPVLESDAPYRNKEGLIECEVPKTGGASGETEKLYLTQEQIDEREQAGQTVTRLNWAGNYEDANGKKVYTDWSVDDSLWNASLMNLENGNTLPNTTILKNGEYDHTDLAAVAAIKKEICERGRAVACAFTAFDGYYNEDTASYYNSDANDANHAVCIVGFDDNYPKTNFNDGKDYIPPENGAWLVRNSWGAQSEDFPNNGDWGIVEDGEHTGYFWLSYYDRSASYFESFDFDLESYGDTTEYYIDQYDYLLGEKTVVNSYDTPVSSANVFTAKGDMALRTLGCTTFRPNTTVNYQVYLLDDEAASPTDAEHAKLVYSLTDVYEYGGYHRATLAEDDWVAMRAGQRYAVVTTQRCADDGKWYQGAVVSSAKNGFQAKVNAGESWTGATAAADAGAAGGAGDEAAASVQGADAQTSWRDWTEVTGAIEKKDADAQVDNLSVKGFSEPRSWASVDELSALETAIARAQDAVEVAVVSADGFGVDEGAMWLSQEKKDELVSALPGARETLALAGEGYRDVLENTTPDSATVNAATDSLAFEAGYGAAKPAPAADNPAASKDTASTGDAAFSALPVLACVAAAAFAVLVAAVAYRRIRARRR